jgi:dTDP-4-dehydrorhamnose reductase
MIPWFLVTFFLLTASLYSETILVFGGKTGWIGQEIVQVIRRLGHDAVCATSRLEHQQDMIDEIDRIKPDAIVNCAGLIGKPNVDWCETHKIETLRVNVLGTLNLIDAAYLRNIHLTNITTGCIYEYDETHPERGGMGFTERDSPNFDGSFYSRSKIQMEALALEYPNVLNLRIKMPIGRDVTRGFVAKIVGYKKVIDVANSFCILDDLLPIAVDMTLQKIKGNFNFVNPGVLSHAEILQLYKKYVDPKHSWEVFTVEEQNTILKARRANAELSPAKLMELYPNIPDVRNSLIQIFMKIAQAKG